MSVYRMFAGMIAFISIVFLGLTFLASNGYPSLIPGGQPIPTTADQVRANMCPSNAGIVGFLSCFIPGAISSMINGINTIGSFVIGVVTFNVPALADIGFIGLLIRMIILACLAFIILIFVFRLVRSIIPFSGSEG